MKTVYVDELHGECHLGKVTIKIGPTFDKCEVRVDDKVLDSVASIAIHVIPGKTTFAELRLIKRR